MKNNRLFNFKKYYKNWRLSFCKMAPSGLIKTKDFSGYFQKYKKA